MDYLKIIYKKSYIFHYKRYKKNWNKNNKYRTDILILYKMPKSSAELAQKAAGYMLASANAAKRELKQTTGTAKTTPKKSTGTGTDKKSKGKK